VPENRLDLAAAIRVARYHLAERIAARTYAEPTSRVAAAITDTALSTIPPIELPLVSLVPT
jgi:hypothetical protein